MERKYTIKDHGDGKTYDITEDPNGYPIYRENTAIPIAEAAKLHQQTKTTDELIAEARSLIEYNNKHKPEPKQEPKQSRFDKEIERSKKEWDYYFMKNPSKIPYKLPNLFDKHEQE